MPKTTTPLKLVPIKKQELATRVNRRLEYDNEMVARLNLAAGSAGEYMLYDFNRGAAALVELESLGRELGCLSAWEYVVD